MVAVAPAADGAASSLQQSPQDELARRASSGWLIYSAARAFPVIPHVWIGPAILSLAREVSGDRVWFFATENVLAVTDFVSQLLILVISTPAGSFMDFSPWRWHTMMLTTVLLAVSLWFNVFVATPYFGVALVANIVGGVAYDVSAIGHSAFLPEHARRLPNSRTSDNYCNNV